MVKDKAGLAVENGASRSCTRTRSEGLDGIRCREGDDEVEGQVGYNHRHSAQRGFVVVGPLGKREEKGQQLYTMYEAWQPWNCTRHRQLRPSTAVRCHLDSLVHFHNVA